MKSFFKKLSYRRDPGRHIHIRLGTVCDKYAVFFHPADLSFIAVYTMRHNRTCIFTEQSECIINVSVKLRPRTKFFYPCDLALVFGKMRLYRETVSLLDFCQSGHKFVTAGRGKTRGENRFDVLIFSCNII